MTRPADYGDGWFALLDTLCAEIQRRVEAGRPQVRAIRVEQTFGSLRFDYAQARFHGFPDNYVRGLVQMAEALSGSLCDRCGAPGRACSADDHRVMTRCRDHWESSEPFRPIPTIATSWAGADVEPRSRLPPIKNPGLRHLAQALENLIAFEVRNGNLDPIVVDEVIETEGLAFRWHYSSISAWPPPFDHTGLPAGYLRMVEAYSRRCDPLTGRMLEDFSSGLHRQG